MADTKIFVGSGKKSAQYDIVNINICLSDIPKEHITKAQNGKSYVKLNVGAKQAVNQYGNSHSVSVDTWKPTPKGGITQQYDRKPEPIPAKVEQETDDLPF